MKALELFSLAGKTAIITGGGRGIGRIIAVGLAEAGADVAVASRNLENCTAVAGEIAKSTGNRALAFELDVTDEDSVSLLVKAVKDQLGGIDILVNNSGAAWGARFEEMPLEKWELVLRTNLTGTFLMSQAVVPEMEQRKWGRIINVSSISRTGGSSGVHEHGRLHCEQRWNYFSDPRARCKTGSQWNYSQRHRAEFFSLKNDQRLCSKIWGQNPGGYSDEKAGRGG